MLHPPPGWPPDCAPPQTITSKTAVSEPATQLPAPLPTGWPPGSTSLLAVKAASSTSASACLTPGSTATSDASSSPLTSSPCCNGTRVHEPRCALAATAPQAPVQVPVPAALAASESAAATAASSSHSSVLPQPAVGSAEWKAGAPPCNRWGFVERDRPSDNPPPDNRVVRKALEVENSRTRKWVLMMGDEKGKQLWPSVQKQHPQLKRRQLARRVHKGIPEPVRGVAWLALTGVLESPALTQKYMELKARASVQGSLPAKVADQIELDLARTYPTHVLWRGSSMSDGSAKVDARTSSGVGLLRSLLRTFALYDKEVQYCQAMNYVAGLLLMYLTEEQAFRLFVQLLCGCHLRELYLDGMAPLMDHLQGLSSQIAHTLPRLSVHLQAQAVDASFYATQWFMCFGLDQSMPFPMAVRMFDLICLEHSLLPVYRVAVALLQREQARLRSISDMSELLTELKKLPARIDDMDAFFEHDVAQVRVDLTQHLLRRKKEFRGRTASV
eukprot:CAMPEP_0119360298 /NCGR_PEP_ID=MMETSP1334-20130426/7947_1 /TAXON_ID=127549 /ORGANISM="Calcidiscus leptoporus, Strain RCC1130" /LENGTH=500 /DNA_ID=CAMNT_0007375119 /DNA_START=1 /DNA_END=1503 /DNA_ORIENTATION=-